MVASPHEGARVRAGMARSLKRFEHERFVSALPEPILPAASGIEHCAAWDSNPARRIKSPVLYPMS